jgi:hypothetical protein
MAERACMVDAKVVINSDASVSGTLTVGFDIVLSAGAAE